MVCCCFLDILARLVYTQISNGSFVFTRHSDLLTLLLHRFINLLFTYVTYLFFSVMTKSKTKRNMLLKEQIVVVIGVLMVTQSAWGLQNYDPSHTTTIFEGKLLETAVF